MSVEDDIDNLLGSLNKKKLDNIIEKQPEKKETIIIEEKKEVIKNEDDERVLDTIQEQIESPMTTSYSPQSINEKDLDKISENPENYIEINFIKKVRVVDSFYIPSNIKRFNYNNKIYKIIEENIYILPTKKGFFMPTCFYKEDNLDPIDFSQKNKGISGKVLSLLYNINLYNDLFSSEEGQYNLFIVIMLIISISAYLIGLYFLLGGGI